jgi:hypothetical protein
LQSGFGLAVHTLRTALSATTCDLLQLPDKGASETLVSSLESLPSILDPAVDPTVKFPTVHFDSVTAITAAFRVRLGLYSDGVSPDSRNGPELRFFSGFSVGRLLERDSLNGSVLKTEIIVEDLSPPTSPRIESPSVAARS